IRIGAKAVLTMPEYPNRTFAATVEASSQSVDISSGTTRMQLALDNSKGELMPGGYANVRLPLQRDAVPLHIPASALIFNKDGLRVATVGPDDKVLFKTVTIARELTHPPLQHAGLGRDDIADRSYRRAVQVQQMRERRHIAGRDTGQRPRVGLGAHHHHAVLDLTLALVDHCKALDLALASGFG